MKRKQCLFCGMHFTGGPFQIRVHLDAAMQPRSIRACKPSSQWKERHTLVLACLRSCVAAMLSASAQRKRRWRIGEGEGEVRAPARSGGQALRRERA